jgi:hypothetical protein
MLLPPGCSLKAGFTCANPSCRHSAAASVQARWLHGIGEEAPLLQDYLIGELSVWLEELQATKTCPAAREVTRLRYEVEAGPPAGLTSAALRALALADALCWESLSRGDAPAFAQQARVSAELRLFGVCARLLPDSD